MLRAVVQHVPIQQPTRIRLQDTSGRGRSGGSLNNEELLQVIRANKAWLDAPDIVSKNLDQLLSTTIIMKSRANSTTKTYLRITRKFFGWCKANGIQLKLPFHSSVVALYLHSESKRACSSLTITVASAALKWLHGFSPETNLNPLNTDFCKHVIEAPKRTVNNSVHRKTPLTSQATRDIIDKFGRNNNLKDLSAAAICTLGFAGSFRYDELKNKYETTSYQTL